MFGGFVIANSETGCGAFILTPRLVIQVCDNGMTITRDALRSVHLGGRMDEGVIRWSHDTQQRNLRLVTAQARDAVTTFPDASYVQAKITEIARAAALPVIDVMKKAAAGHEPEALRAAAVFVRAIRPTSGGLMTILAKLLDRPDLAASNANLRGKRCRWNR